MRKAESGRSADRGHGPRWLFAIVVLWSGCAIAADLAHARQRGYLNIGTSGTAVPYSWVNAKNELIGFDIDWGNLVGKELNLPVRWIKTDFRGLFPALQSGQLDLVISGVRIRPDLQKSFLFSIPYSHEATVGVVKDGNVSMTSVSDLKGRRVAAVAASFQEDYAKRIGGYEELLSLPTGADVFLALHTGHADVALTGLTSATHYLRRGNKVRIVSEGAVLNPQGMVIGKESLDLKAAVDRIIARRMADGTYADLYRSHFHLDPPKLP